MLGAAELGLDLPALNQAEQRVPQAFPADMQQLVVDELSSPAFRQLEELLLICKDAVPSASKESFPEPLRPLVALSSNAAVPHWYLPLRLIMYSTSNLTKKFMLTPMRPFVLRPIFLWLDELRSHFDSFFSLRLCWDELEPPTTEELNFVMPEATLKAAKKGAFSELRILEELWPEYRVQVKNKLSLQGADKQQLVCVERLRTKFALFANRICSCLGYVCVETSGTSACSFSAVVDDFADFLEDGDSLEGSRLARLQGHALHFLVTAKKEAQVRFSSFITSRNPSFSHPSSFIEPGSKAIPLLQKRKEQLASLITLEGFCPEVLSSTSPVTASFLAPSHSQALPLLGDMPLTPSGSTTEVSKTLPGPQQSAALS